MSYIGTQPTPQSLESRQEFTATASQTTFATSGYTVGYVDVYLNGVKLSTSDFTATNGSDIVLGSGATAGDVLAVVMKNDHSDLVALPITDSAGNNVLDESGGTVTLTADAAVIEGSSSGDLVRITQTGTGNALVVEDDTNPDSTPFVIDNTGIVIIGTTAKEDISGFSAISFQIHGIGASSGGGSRIASVRWQNSSSGSGIVLAKSRSETVGSYSIVSNNDIIGEIEFSADDGTDLNTDAANIKAEVDGTPGANDMPGRLVFSTTADGESSPTERMFIKSSGNVSIGTSDPGDYRLKVENSGDNKGAAYITSTGSNCWGLEIGTHTGNTESDLVFTSNAVVGSQASISFVTDSPSGFWRWMTGGTSHKTGTDGATEVVRIDSSGNVGIGDSTPDAALDVVGNIHYTGTITDVSDRRLKENITDLTDSLNKVSQLEGKSYTLIADRGNEGDTTEYGFIAQNVQEVFPEAVKVIQKYAVDENGEPTEEELNYLGVSYIQLIAPMVEAIKELKAKNEAFESQINALTARIEALEATP